jgi:hypothetical protein
VGGWGGGRITPRVTVTIANRLTGVRIQRHRHGHAGRQAARQLWTFRHVDGSVAHLESLRSYRQLFHGVLVGSWTAPKDAPSDVGHGDLTGPGVRTFLLTAQRASAGLPFLGSPPGCQVTPAPFSGPGPGPARMTLMASGPWPRAGASLSRGLVCTPGPARPRLPTAPVSGRLARAQLGPRLSCPLVSESPHIGLPRKAARMPKPRLRLRGHVP